MNKQKLLNQSF